MKCHLCLQEKQLVNSHIIPEALYRTVYDDKHKLYLLSTSDKEKTQCKQIGFREKLLCCDCDNSLSPFEKYTKELFYKLLISDKWRRNTITFQGIDYKKLKLFQLSILWRASISQQDFFSEVRLTVEHQEKLRQMIFNKNPGEPHEYGCLMIGIRMEQDASDQIIIHPRPGRLEGHRCYIFTFAGCFWVFVVSRHSRNFLYRDSFLTKNGKLPMRLMEAKNIAIFQKLSRDLKAQGKLDAVFKASNS